MHLTLDRQRVHVCIPVYLCEEPCAELFLHQCTGALEELGWNGHVSLGRSKGSRCPSQKYRYSYTGIQVIMEARGVSCEDPLPLFILRPFLKEAPRSEDKGRMVFWEEEQEQGSKLCGKLLTQGWDTSKVRYTIPHIEDGHPRDREAIAQKSLHVEISTAI